MRFFTRGWASGELSDDEGLRTETAYAARLEAIAAKLPPSMNRLLHGVSLHDALIESVRWRRSVAELHVTFVAGTSEVGYETVDLVYRGAMLGKQRLESLRNAASDREACVLYQEVDILDDGILAHRLLFWPSQEVTIDFRELDYAAAPRSDCRVALGGAFFVEAEDDDDR